MIDNNTSLIIIIMHFHNKITYNTERERARVYNVLDKY